MKKAMLTTITSLSIVIIASMSCKKDSTQQIAPTITGITPTFDTTGGVVTITGTNFLNVTGVSFGGTPAASFNVVSTTIITAIVGGGSAGKVSVTTAGGIATYSGFGFPTIYCGCSNSDQIATTNLIAHWPFDNSPNEALSNLPPMLTGGTSAYVKGRLGQAISLTDGWLTYPAAATFAGIANDTLNSNDTLRHGFTITLWVQFPAAPKKDSLLTNLFQLSGYPGTPNWPLAGIAASKFADSTLGLGGGITNLDSNGLHPSYDSAYFKTLIKDTVSSWAFIGLVYTNGHQLQYYYNGVLVGQQALITDTTAASVFPEPELFYLPTPNYATIGAFESTTTFPLAPASDILPPFMNPGLTGVLDDIRLFNISLSAQNINDLYFLGTSGK